MAEEKRELTPSQGTPPVPAQHLRFGNTVAIDTSMLTEDQHRQLVQKQAEGLVAIDKKAQEMRVDVSALSATMNQLADTTQKVAESGNSVTITHTQTTSIGRTEINMGNTDKARKGTISSSASGLPDKMLIYVAIGAAVLVLLAFIFAR